MELLDEMIQAVGRSRIGLEIDSANNNGPSISQAIRDHSSVTGHDDREERPPGSING